MMLHPASLLVFCLGVILFFSPVVLWIAAWAPAWWWPFLAWAGFILVIALGITPQDRRPSSTTPKQNTRR